MQHIKHFMDSQNFIYASVSINVQTQLIMTMWRGQVTESHQLSDVINFCCEQMNEHNLKSWLSDFTAIQGHFHGLSAHAQKMVFENVALTPLKHFALVSQLAANPSRSALLHALRQVKVEVRSFDLFAPAIEWLILPAIEDNIWESVKQKVY